MIETNIDDMTPEVLSYVEEKLFDLGALDVYTSSIMMKKGRLAWKLSVLTDENCESIIQETILKETSTLGLRKYEVEKIMLERDFITINTKYGDIPVKLGIIKGKIAKSKGEYDECKKIAKDNNISINEVYDELKKYDVKQIWRSKNEE